MKYILGTSYFDGGRHGREFRDEMMRHWMGRASKLDVAPQRIVVICEGDSELKHRAANVEVLKLPGNLGHVGEHLNGTKRFEFTGWSASMLTLATAAYTAECDLMYSESDNLPFGPIVARTYDDLGTACLVFGHKQPSAPFMPCSQAWFLVRHAFIPTFVSTYLRLGRDGDVRSLGEQKFIRIEERFGNSLVHRLSFGVDRCRPIPWEESVWYAQQWTQEELDEAKRRGLI